MSFSVGIIGLPNVGKSTLFKALTCQKVDISNYPFCTIDPNVGVVEVPDQRLDKIAELIKPKKITPAAIEFVDIAGLVKEAHKGEGLGNQFLANIREVKIICHVIRVFDDDNITHVEGKADPQRDIAIISTELAMKDLETVENKLAKVAKEAKSGDKKAQSNYAELIAIQAELNEGKQLKGDYTVASELQLLSAKPVIYVFNIKEGQSLKDDFLIEPSLKLDLKIQSETSELTESEQKELQLDTEKINELITLCYQTLDLITFYTIKGGRELRAWAISKGSNAVTAAGVVHSDFADMFIKAEVLGLEHLSDVGGWQAARDKGRLRTEGKNYIVSDGDIMEFKI